MRILIIRFSSIGDIVLTTPVVRALHQQLGAEVHFLSKKQFASILQPNPYLYKVWEWDGGTPLLIRQLKQTSFDSVIDLHKNLRSLRLRLSLRVRSHTLYKANVEKWLKVRLKWDCLPKEHIVDRYMAAIGPLGLRNDGQGLDFFISPKDEQAADAFLLQHQISGAYLVLVLGAAHATKVPPLSFYENIIERYPNAIVLLGGPEEQSKGAALAEMRAGVTNAAGAMSIGASAGLLQKAAWVVTPDTGMMHIAAALDKDIISVWGSTIPSFGMFPYLKKDSTAKVLYLENNSLICRPCSKIGFDTCPRQHFNCMQKLPLQKLWEILEV